MQKLKFKNVSPGKTQYPDCGVIRISKAQQKMVAAADSNHPAGHGTAGHVIQLGGLTVSLSAFLETTVN